MKKILIVEDDLDMRTMLVDAFTKAGFKTSMASNGEEGLKATLDFKPDLILLDILMPVMDGMTMLDKLRREEWGKDVPVTILTNLGDLGKISEALGRGVFKYIVKSDLSIDAIVKKVAKELE